MDKEIVEKVIEKLGQRVGSSGRFVQFSDSSYKAVEFDKSNFRQIKDFDGNARIAFIDGGNNIILDAANFCLQVIRTYCVIYSGNKKKESRKNEFFALVSSSSLGNDLVFDVDVFGADEGFNSFSAFDSTLAKGRHRINAAEVAAACRKLAELKQAILLVDKLESGDIIVLDRDLQATITGEKELLDELYANAEEKGVVVCGLSKTTRLFTDTGDSAVAAIASIAPASDWWYLPVAEINNDGHRAEICFVKLHKNSKYVFRFEIYQKQKDEVEKVLGLLKKNSTDPVFLGYPYGLIEADRFARVSNDEAEYLRVMLLSKAGKDSSKIINYMKSVDAHSILDNIT